MPLWASSKTHCSKSATKYSVFIIKICWRHALEQVALERRDQWQVAVRQSVPIRRQRKRPLLQKLGFNIERRTGILWALSAADHAWAIAVRIRGLADANDIEVKAVRRAYESARESLAPCGALFDILAVSRLNDELQESIALGITSTSEDVRQGLPDSAPHKVTQETMKATPPFHFSIAFPQIFLRERAGSDVILGNPPWEKAKLEEHGFWVRYVLGLQGMPQHQRG